MRSTLFLGLLAGLAMVASSHGHRHHHHGAGGGGSRSYESAANANADHDYDETDDSNSEESHEFATTTKATTATTLKRLWRGTHNQTCRTFYDCDERQECVSVDDASGEASAAVCRCLPAYAYDAERAFCRTRHLACEDYCDLVNGYECLRGECRWSYRPPGADDHDSWSKTDADNSGTAMPSVGFFSLFAVAILIVLLIWKCTMQRRLNQLIEAVQSDRASRAVAARRTADELFPDGSGGGGPTTWTTAAAANRTTQATRTMPPPPCNDEPPKYSSVVIAAQPSTSQQSRAAADELMSRVNECAAAVRPTAGRSSASAPPLSTLSLHVSRAETAAAAQQRSTDAPPPYSEIAPPPLTTQRVC